MYPWNQDVGSSIIVSLKRSLWITRGMLLVLMAISLGQTVILFRWRRWALDCWRDRATCAGCGTVTTVPDVVGVCVANCGTPPLASSAAGNPAARPSLPRGQGSHRSKRPLLVLESSTIPGLAHDAGSVAIVKFIFPESKNEVRFRCAFDNQPIRGHAVQESAEIPGLVHDAEVHFELEMLRGEWHVGNGLKVLGVVE